MTTKSQSKTFNGWIFFCSTGVACKPCLRKPWPPTLKTSKNQYNPHNQFILHIDPCNTLIWPLQKIIFFPFKVPSYLTWPAQQIYSPSATAEQALGKNACTPPPIQISHHTPPLPRFEPKISTQKIPKSLLARTSLWWPLIDGWEKANE